MRENVETLINSEFPVIVNDGALTMLLLKTYAYLFLPKGQAPPFCSKCMRGYHQKIIQQGIKKIEFMENKTNVLKEGNHFVRSEGMHYSNNNLSDEKAIELLNNKKIKEYVFITLPKGYNNEPKETESIELTETIELTEDNKGKFTDEILINMNGQTIMSFAQSLTGDKVKNKKEAIKAILNWQA